MAKQEIRMVNGNRYLYYTHYQKGDRKVVYCGRADEIDSKIKGSKLELEQTIILIEELQARRKELKTDIANLNKAKRKEKRVSSPKKRDSAVAKKSGT